MFTGIVEELGVVVAVEPRADAATLTIGCEKVLDDVAHGASIAVNGVCLTVTSFSGQHPRGVHEPAGPAGPAGRGGRGGATPSFTVDVMKETLDRTSLGGLAVGDQVNLERPVRLADRLGGHLVQGHVDGVGTLVERHHGTHWDTIRVSLPPGLDRYLVEKGSVTLDGVSLTVVDVTPPTPAPSAPAGTPAAAGTGGEPASFTIGLIPTTLASTTLGRRAPGDQLNIEVDVISKYVEKLFVEKVSAQARELSGIVVNGIAR
jgi:riboflavin synthase